MTSATLERSDHELVAAVRHGDERAFEALYARYHRRIHAFVLGMVKDHGRAEDVTQEVFVSALRRVQATERPIAFKPWIYEIAKNACIDAFRRSRRAEEVSYDAAEGLTPGDHRRLTGADATPERAVAAKQELETLCGAFGGLSDAHHEILVMRELEGLSYREIGERMGMTRPAVESTLFRARRRLTEEYGELVSGERCRRVQAIIADAASGALGARDARRLARHIAHCQPCRREALASGLDRSLIARPPLRRRAAAKVAAWLPFPGLLRGHLPLFSGTSKAVAGAAVLAAGVGAGIGVEQELVQQAPAAPAHVAGAPAHHARAASTRPAPAAVRRVAGASGAKTLRRATTRAATTATVGNVVRRGAVRPAAGAPARPTPSRAGGASTPRSSSPASSRRAAKPAAPAVPSVANPVTAMPQTVSGVTNTVDQTVSGVTNTVQQTVSGVTNAVQGAGESAQGVTDQTGKAVHDVTDAVGGVVNGVAGAVPTPPPAPRVP